MATACERCSGRGRVFVCADFVALKDALILSTHQNGSIVAIPCTCLQGKIVEDVERAFRAEEAQRKREVKVT